MYVTKEWNWRNILILTKIEMKCMCDIFPFIRIKSVLEWEEQTHKGSRLWFKWYDIKEKMSCKRFYMLLFSILSIKIQFKCFHPINVQNNICCHKYSRYWKFRTTKTCLWICNCGILLIIMITQYPRGLISPYWR